ncbi:transposase [Streptomyces sp. NPDC058773]|uniref:transposase n=1 Tax=Streptomyces sp. NPDC058773 TaxID=3346632 RepID=UPI0036B75623
MPAPEFLWSRCGRRSAASAAGQFRLDQSAVGPGVPLTDVQWARIEPWLPDRTPKRGGRWRDHREVIDAIAFKFQTGTQWVHLPEKYGNWRGVYNRLRRWARPSGSRASPCSPNAQARPTAPCLRGGQPPSGGIASPKKTRS